MNVHEQKPSVQGAGGAQLIVGCHSVSFLLVENPDSRGRTTSVSELSSLGGLAAKHGQDDLHTYTNPSQKLGPRLGKLPESLSIPRLHAESSLKRWVCVGSLTPSGPAEGPSPLGAMVDLQEGLLGGLPLSTFLRVGRPNFVGISAPKLVFGFWFFDSFSVSVLVGGHTEMEMEWKWTLFFGGCGCGCGCGCDCT